MPQLIIDNINNAALDTIGDLLIDTSSAGEPVIMAEYAAAAMRMLQIRKGGADHATEDT